MFGVPSRGSVVRLSNAARRVDPLNRAERVGEQDANFAQVGATHQAHSYSATGNIQTYVEAPFSTYDASVGVSKDAWNVQFYGQNLSDTRANLYENGNQFINAITVNRPRTLGVKIGYKF